MKTYRFERVMGSNPQPDAWIILHRLTPSKGKPVARCYSAEAAMHICDLLNRHDEDKDERAWP